MRTIPASVLAIALICGAASAQDEGDDASAILKEGLRATADKGGFSVRGTARLETSDRRYAYYVRSLGIDSDLTASVGSDGATDLSLETKEGDIEIWTKGGKTVYRAVWTRALPNPGVVGAEIAKLIGIVDLRKAIRKATNLKVLDEREIRGKKCRVVQGRFPVDLIKTESMQQQPGVRMQRNMTQVARLVLTFSIGEDDHIVRRIEAKVLRTTAYMQGSFRRQNDDDEEEEDEEKKPDDDVKNLVNTTNYTLTFGDFDPERKVEIPKSVRKHLED